MRVYDYPQWASALAKLLPASVRQRIRNHAQLNRKLLSLANRTPIKLIPLDKVLLGGEAGMRALDIARLFHEPLRPSTRVADGHHIDLLRLYDEMGEAVFATHTLAHTRFYKNIAQCMHFTGHYGEYSRLSDIETIARHFCAQYRTDKETLQSAHAFKEEPILVMPVAHSGYVQIFDGHHRAARAAQSGATHIYAVMLDTPVYTYIQDLLMSVLWVGGRREIYQPIQVPEVTDGWTLVRACTDRLEHMQRYLQSQQIPAGASYIDLGSNHGWFVHEMHKLGYDAYGVERDYFGRKIGEDVYGLDVEKRVTLSDLVNYLEDAPKRHAVTSCFSVLHHYLLHGQKDLAARVLRAIDGITEHVFFFETAHGHENIHPILAEWDDASIEAFLREHTSFRNITLLGHDHDNVGRFSGAYRRALFACSR